MSQQHTPVAIPEPLSHNDPRWSLFLALVAVMESGQLGMESEAWMAGVAALAPMGYEVITEKQGTWVSWVDNDNGAARPMTDAEVKDFPL